MDDQQQRIAIAEACGFKAMKASPGLMWDAKENRAVITPGSEVEKARLRTKLPYKAGTHTVPDYLNDLNAIHEAEMWLIKEFNRQLSFGQHLRWLCADKNVWHATARQRAEAFLRTIGKWTDQPSATSATTTATPTSA